MTRAKTASPLVPVSWGELLDKISILTIKSERVSNPVALANVREELAQLSAIATELLAGSAALRAAFGRLKTINETLWEIEDRIREKEREQNFDADFIALARSVYQNNDERSAIKRDINLVTGSALIEEKQYSPYTRSG